MSPETLAREIADAVAELCGWQRGGPDSDRVAQTVRPLLAPLLEEQERLRKAESDGRYLPAHAVLWMVCDGRICRKQHAPDEPHEWEPGLDQLRDRAEAAEAEAAKLKTELDAAAQKIEGYIEDFAKLREERDALRSLREAEREAKDRLVDKAIALGHTVESLTSENDALEAKVADLEAQLQNDYKALWEADHAALEAEREKSGRMERAGKESIDIAKRVGYNDEHEWCYTLGRFASECEPGDDGPHDHAESFRAPAKTIARLLSAALSPAPAQEPQKCGAPEPSPVEREAERCPTCSKGNHSHPWGWSFTRDGACTCCGATASDAGKGEPRG